MAIFLALALLATGSTSALANNVNKEKGKKDPFEDRMRMINNLIKENAHDRQKLDEVLEANGLVKVEEVAGDENQVGIESLGSQVTLSYSKYYDDVSHYYCFDGYWDWSGTFDGGGTYDSVGIWLADTDGTSADGAIISSPDIWVYDEDGDSHDVGWVSDLDLPNKGVAFNFDDQDGIIDDVGYHGDVCFWVTQRPTANQAILKLVYEHTWDTGLLSSTTIGVSNGIVTLTTSYSDPPHVWRRAGSWTINF